jgi:hypothetical protein
LVKRELSSQRGDEPRQAEQRDGRAIAREKETELCFGEPSIGE